MSVNKVILDTEHGQEVLLDVSQDTVSPGTLARGVTATNAAGKKITGIVDLKTKATAISDSVSGKSVVIEKSGDDSLIGLTLYGKTEQFTTSGKNLLENKAQSKTVDGITFTRNTNGSITVNGTNTSNKTIYLDVYYGDFVSGNFIFSGCPSGGGTSTYRLSINMTNIDNGTTTGYVDTGNSIAFSYDENYRNFTVMIVVGAGVSMNNLTFKPMIRLASIADDTYEPYTGGIASPNPQYPQELVSVGADGDVEVGVYGGNLFDITNFTNIANGKSVTSHGITFTNVNNKYIKVTGTATNYPNIQCKVKLPKGTYVLSGVENSRLLLLRARVYKGDTSKDYACNAPFVIDDDVTLVHIMIQADIGWTVDSVIYPMLNVGTEPLPYEPYKAKQTLSIPTPNGLPAIKVTDPSLATYVDEDGNMWCADTIDYERGVYVKRVIAESRTKVNAFISSDKSFFFVVLNNAVLTKQFFYCNVATHKDNNMDFGNAWITGDDRLIIGNLDESGNPVYSTIDELFNGIDKIEFIYILTTPIEIPLTQEEIAEFSVLHSNYPFTTILNNYNALMDVKYSLHTQTYIDEADNKVRDLVEQNKSLINDLKRVKANAIVQKVEGESVVVSDSSDDALRGLRVFGKTEQFTTTGAQLYDIWSCDVISSGTYTNKGVTTTILEDGGVLMQGTPEVESGAIFNIYSDNIIDRLVDGESYIANIPIKITQSDGTVNYVKNISNLDKSTITSVQPYIQKSVDNYKDGDIVYPMFNAGATLLPYEPYTGGIPSPSPQYPQRLKTIGKGKNLLQNTATSKAGSGVTLTVNREGRVTGNGTATTTTTLVLNRCVNRSESLILSGCPSGGSNETYKLSYVEDANSGNQHNDYGDGVVLPKDDVEYEVRIVVYAGTTLNNLTFYPMIRYADIEDTTYEPYGKDDIEVGKYGAQLANLPDVESYTVNGITFSCKGGVVTAKGTSTSDASSRPSGIWHDMTGMVGTFCVSQVVEGTADDVTVYARIIRASGNEEYPSRGASFTLDGTETGVYFYIQISKNKTVDATIYPMLNYGTTPLPFEPYKAPQTLTALTPNGLPGIKVTDASIATYTDADGQMWCADEIDFERGVYVKRIKTLILNSTMHFEEWPTKNGNRVRFMHKVSDMVEISCRLYAISNFFSAKTMGEVFDESADNAIFMDVTSSSTNRYIGICSSAITTRAELNTFLDANEVVVHYILKTPIETPLSEEELAQYRALHSNYPVTTVLNDSEAHMEVKYNADTKNYIDNKFAELQTALIALGGI